MRGYELIAYARVVLLGVGQELFSQLLTPVRFKAH
jgi:hypothetical protein